MLTPNLSPVSVAVHRAVGEPKRVALESWEIQYPEMGTESYHSVSPELLANAIILGTMMDITTIALRQGGVLSTSDRVNDSDVVELLGNSIANQMKL